MTQTPEVNQVLRSHLEHFRWRVLQDALTEATTAYWERRAADFDWVADSPTPSDPHGIKARARVTSQACRNKAALVREDGLDDEARAVIALILLERHGQVTR